MTRDPDESLKIKQDGGSRNQSAFLWGTVLLSPSRTDPMNSLLSYLATKTTQRLGVHFSTIKASNRLETDISEDGKPQIKIQLPSTELWTEADGFYKPAM